MASKTDSATKSIAVGLDKGFPTAKVAKSKKTRPSNQKGKLNAKVKVVREIVRETCGLTPLEKRLIDIFKLGIGNPDKRVYKISKHRLGTHKRALKKREGIKKLYSDMRAAAAVGK